MNEHKTETKAKKARGRTKKPTDVENVAISLPVHLLENIKDICILKNMGMSAFFETSAKYFLEYLQNEVKILNTSGNFFIPPDLYIKTLDITENNFLVLEKAGKINTMSFFGKKVVIIDAEDKLSLLFKMVYLENQTEKNFRLVTKLSNEMREIKTLLDNQSIIKKEEEEI